MVLAVSKAIKQLLNKTNNDDLKSNDSIFKIFPRFIKDLKDESHYDMVSLQKAKNKELKVVTIADCHGSLKPEELDKIAEQPDLVFLLGDNDASDIQLITDFFKKNSPDSVMVGITGNHDTRKLLQDIDFEAKIRDIHRSVIKCLDVRIGGFSGSIRYKPNPNDYYSMYSNEEGKAMLSELPDCDILITHDKPCYFTPISTSSHSGLVGIGDYIKTKKPAFVFHGHLHDNYVEQYKDTLIRCCYRVEFFTVKL